VTHTIKNQQTGLKLKKILHDMRALGWMYGPGSNMVTAGESAQYDSKAVHEVQK
jgi:hypothetical protein